MIQKKIAAVCLCLCLGITGTVTQPIQPIEGKNVNQNQEISVSTTLKQAKKKSQTVKKMGKVYKLAKNYKQVYKVLKKGSSARNDYYVAIDYAMAEDASSAVPNAAADGAVSTPTETNSTPASSSTNEASEDSSYSTTNLQVEGVDESDIVKTDGKYLYVVQEQEVKILDLQNKVPKKAATLTPEGLSDEGWIREMYVADGVLVLVTEEYETELSDTSYANDNTGIGSAKLNRVIAYDATGYAYRIHTKMQTKAISYDISNPKKPVYLDTTVQDGRYETSRKVGEKLYLFTTNYLYNNINLDEGGNIKDLWLPTVDGEKISANCIYLPEQGNSSIMMSCVQLGKQNQVLDMKLLINNGAEYYVTKDSIYIYNTNYDYTTQDVVERTQIARFALTEDGKIQAVTAKTIRGRIEDTFAINEQNGYLRVLTSITSSSTWENRVYVLDSNLKIKGKLTKLAEGERIYAARFFGNTGYFVTYRNTDPLFTVDLSNPEAPKIIGELKITGFSEYLHFWGNDKLLGIGYETDEKTGEQLGLKLTMFDISKPENVTVEAYVVLKDADYSPATYDYKSVLIDKNKNLIAFTTESYRNEYKTNYRVYSFKDGAFKKRLNYKLDDSVSLYNQRSLYANNVLYLAGQDVTYVFDMKNKYEKLGELSY